MIKVGIIGCGGMGNYHAPVLAKLPNVKVIGACDLIESKAKTLGDKIGVPHCTDYHELLGDVDAVWVCTEPFNRVDIVTTAAKARKHIFTEKPVCNDVANAKKMIAAAKRYHVKYMLGYCLRLWNPYKLIHDTFASGELGELVDCWTRRFMPMDSRTSWYGQQDKSGGVTLDFGSHDINGLLWIGGPAKMVFGQTRRVRDGVQADEHGQAMILFANGGMGAVDISWSSYASESSVGLVGTKGAIIVGRDGQVRKKVGDAPEQIVAADSAMDVNPAGEVGKKDAGGKIQAVARKDESIQEHFFRCIEEDLTPVTPAEDGLQTLLTVKAVVESARRGASVRMPAAR
jgi:UDP-N-acetylglucosamine 3-dehydrogenase